MDCLAVTFELSLDGSGGPFARDFFELVAGCLNILLCFFEHTAEAFEFLFDGANDGPDLAASFLNGQGSEAHLQAV
jgi:hypothetical protein